MLRITGNSKHVSLYKKNRHIYILFFVYTQSVYMYLSMYTVIYKYMHEMFTVLSWHIIACDIQDMSCNACGKIRISGTK